jgi:hypothetical protein
MYSPKNAEPSEGACMRLCWFDVGQGCGTVQSGITHELLYPNSCGQPPRFALQLKRC